MPREPPVTRATRSCREMETLINPVSLFRRVSCKWRCFSRTKVQTAASGMVRTLTSTRLLLQFKRNVNGSAHEGKCHKDRFLRPGFLPVHAVVFSRDYSRCSQGTLRAQSADFMFEIA